MLRLPETTFRAIRGILLEEARPLERALFLQAFEDGPLEAVGDALAGFANEDGGFGHGLEPDMRLPQSSAMATTVGLGILNRFGAPDECDLVTGALRYLAATLDEEALAWPAAPLAVNDYACAPWWMRDPEGPAISEGELDNPRADALASMLTWPGVVAEDTVHRLLASVMERVRGMGESIEGHSFLCYVRLAEAPGLPTPEREELTARVLRALDSGIERDPAKWPGYCIQPLWACESPEGLLAEVLAPDLERNLDYEIGRVPEDGRLRPNWDWGGRCPEEWAVASREWTGVILWDLLRRLRAFGRL